MKNLKSFIREINDFPKPGIVFRDISPLLLDPEALTYTMEPFIERYMWDKVDKVVALDARGFIFGSILAYMLNVGFVPVRKKGKLPFTTVSEKYSLEYGEAELEIQSDAIITGDKIVVMDDLLATGGSAFTATKLVEKLGGNVIECAFVIELLALKGKDKLKDYKVYSLIQY
jgi:adenine phosphoribosyltransferase